MNKKKCMIIINGKIVTDNIESYYIEDNKCHIVYSSSDKVYSYSFSNNNIEILEKFTKLNPQQYIIKRDDKLFFNIEEIYEFEGKNDKYWLIYFKGEEGRNYKKSDLEIEKLMPWSKESRSIFEYLKEIAAVNKLADNALSKKFDKISAIKEETCLAKYLNPNLESKVNNEIDNLIFPFRCNNSQYKAVVNAMKNQFSIIQGPPGTGKTQTILNIIANILVNGKTVQVVSNNNAAIENVFDKLEELNFIAAKLGSFENKKRFIENQKMEYPNLSEWKLNNVKELRQEVQNNSKLLKKIYDSEEKLAELRRELNILDVEYKYFNHYLTKNEHLTSTNILNKLNSKKIIDFWNEFQFITDISSKVNFWNKLKFAFKYKITNWEFYNQDNKQIITAFQNQYYAIREKELVSKITEIEKFLKENKVTENFYNQSMLIFKNYLAEKCENRPVFTEDDLNHKASQVLGKYPLILSTTFSSTTSLNSTITYDYLIIDEASQVDIATGALALSCAKNVIIVGDEKQLPHVITENMKQKTTELFKKYNVNKGYQYTKSLLESVIHLMPNVPVQLLREHYRCHPKIIEFCNQKFYGGQLKIMSKDTQEDDVLTVFKTVEGNHDRSHYNQREIDIIKKEVISKYNLNPDKTGVITPYRKQVNKIKDEIEYFDTATVHKFQGQEKDNIIISTVDNEITDFVDDAHLINVAVSRAKKKLILVTTGNKQRERKNITDLIDYVRYQNFEVIDSKIYSVFDYLYTQYNERRLKLLSKYKMNLRYDSEKLMYLLLNKILKETKYSNLEIVNHYSFGLLINDTKLLDDEDKKYAFHHNTHLDFVICDKLTKKVILAIEVDGYTFHKETSRQYQRDLRKDRILKIYEIPLLRLKTNGSEEEKKIRERLDELVM